MGPSSVVTIGLGAECASDSRFPAQPRLAAHGGQM